MEKNLRYSNFAAISVLCMAEFGVWPGISFPEAECVARLVHGAEPRLPLAKLPNLSARALTECHEILLICTIYIVPYLKQNLANSTCPLFSTTEHQILASTRTVPSRPSSEVYSQISTSSPVLSISTTAFLFQATSQMRTKPTISKTLSEGTSKPISACTPSWPRVSP